MNSKTANTVLNHSSKSISISIITETYPPEVNGVASTIARFIKGLQERGHDITLIRPRQSRSDQAKNELKFREILVSGIPIPGYSSLKIGLPEKRMLVKRWLSNRPDLVHIVTEGPLGWSALEAAKKLNIAVCSDFRTNFDAYSSHYGLSWFKSSIQKYMRHFHNKSHLTMVPTVALKNELMANGFERLKVVARGIDTDVFSPLKRSIDLRKQWGLKDNQKAVLYVGRLAAEKNLRITVDTFNAMQQVNPDIKMIWVGDGPQKGSLEQSCPNSIFTGIQTGPTLANHYASGDIFLFSSVSETFGNVTLEAMASGLAVLAYDYAAAQQFIDHGKNGILADFNNGKSFISQGCEMIKDDFDMDSLRAEARQTTLEASWDKVTQHLEDNYLELIQHSYSSNQYSPESNARGIFINQ